jgi:hypothetical protein
MDWIVGIQRVVVAMAGVADLRGYLETTFPSGTLMTMRKTMWIWIFFDWALYVLFY